MVVTPSTLLQTNMEPDEEPFKEDSSLQRTLFRVLCEFWGVQGESIGVV